MPLLPDLQHEIHQQLGLRFDLAPELLANLARACSLSDFLYKIVTQDIFTELVKGGDLLRRYDGGEVAQSLQAVRHAGDDSSLELLDVDYLDEELRRTRNREMARIIFRDLNRSADLGETMRDLSDLADACIQTALEYHFEKNSARYGRPVGQVSGHVQKMCVLALGKLGANELNVSSDIDLVFFYDEAGTVSGSSGISNQEFFVRTAQNLIKSLDTVLSSGFVFRVDMRLRPYGDSGALILNRVAMEKYFIEQGRDWERYAFVKARPAAGDITLGVSFLDWLQPFVYRRHLDFGAVEALRGMKQLIDDEVARKELGDDIKLGPGGIREVEFIIQAQQLIWGGNKPDLQQRRLLEVLVQLDRGGFLPTDDTGVLRQAYTFLRNSEHVIQAEKDRQTQRLPADELSRQRLASGMGFDTYDEYLSRLNEHRDQVSACFARTMGASNAEKELVGETRQLWDSIWQDPVSRESVLQLGIHGFGSDPAKIAQILLEFSKCLSDIQDIAIDRTQRLMPVLLKLCARELKPDETLQRLLPIINNIVRRSTYLVFLLENIDATSRMVHLCYLSPWVAEQVSKHPILMYELTDRSTGERQFDPESLRVELEEMLVQLDEHDLEGQMDLLRQFKHAMVLKTAVFELLNLSTTMVASDTLTAVAELIVSKASDLAFDYLASRHGEPCDQHGVPQGKCFAVVAYGKLGGLELGYGSDLDIVFLHDADIKGETNGNKTIANTMFFSRLGQRIVHILSSLTRFGLLYEVDLRLRPDGNKGPLIGTLNAYERYLEQEAWTWEHQALVRARYVLGDEDLRSRFEEIRLTILSRHRDEAHLRDEVKAMRAKMRNHGEQENLKHGAGAIVDIEFLVQFLVLANSHRYPELTKWTDKIRLLESLASLEVLLPEEANTLQEAYLTYRSEIHFNWLGCETHSGIALNAYRQKVIKIWERILGD